MEQLKMITHPEFGKIRTEMVKGEPVFAATDICRALGLVKTESVLRKLETYEKLMLKVYASGQNRELLFVNESGLYNLIFRSIKPEAKKFRLWVTSEVLPSIRKTGEYRVVRSGAKRTEAANVELIELLWTIDTFLNHGDKADLAIELGVSRQSMSYVLNGTQRSPRILKALYERALENKRSLRGIYGNVSGALITLKDA